jgi:hypothetical protein
MQIKPSIRNEIADLIMRVGKEVDQERLSSHADEVQTLAYRAEDKAQLRESLQSIFRDLRVQKGIITRMIFISDVEASIPVKNLLTTAEDFTNEIMSIVKRFPAFGFPFELSFSKDKNRKAENYTLRVASIQRSELREAAVTKSRDVNRLEVARNMTAKILARAEAENLFEILFPVEDIPIPSSLKYWGDVLAAYSSLFSRESRIVIPSQALLALDEKELEAYFSLILEAFGKTGLSNSAPRIYIAGDKDGRVKQFLFSSDFIRRKPELAAKINQVFKVEAQKENVIAGRLFSGTKALAVSFIPDNNDESGFDPRIPAFLLKADEIRQLDEADRLLALHRLTQFLLFASTAGSGEIKTWLNQAGSSIQQGKYPELSFQTLLSDKLTTYLTQIATAKAA